MPIIYLPEEKDAGDYVMQGISNFASKIAKVHQDRQKKKKQSDQVNSIFAKLEELNPEKYSYKAKINPSDLDKSIFEVSNKTSKDTQADKKVYGALRSGGRLIGEKGLETFKQFESPTEAKQYAQANQGMINPKAISAMSERYGEPVTNVMNQPIFKQETYSPSKAEMGYPGAEESKKENWATKLMAKLFDKKSGNVEAAEINPSQLLNKNTPSKKIKTSWGEFPVVSMSDGKPIIQTPKGKVKIVGTDPNGEYIIEPVK